jgi:transcription-repair coupling factor (superfamily II helicase)
MPASEALLDEESIKRFRARYREQFGANATGDPLYQAVSDGRRLAGMEHWLPLFEERLETLFDHLGADDLILRDGGVDGAVSGRREAIQDYFSNRERAMVAEPGSYRPLAPPRSTCRARSGRRCSPTGRCTSPPPSPSPRRQGDRLRRDPRARLRAGAGAEREHLRSRRQARRQAAENKQKVVLASYTTGARERLAGLLKDHG